MNIIVPMAGLGERIAKGGYTVPKPLVKVQNKIIVEWAIKSLKLDANFIFCCKQIHIDKYNIDKILKNIIPDCIIVPINYHTEGTVQTILEAKKYIDNDEELIISDSDHYIIWDELKFQNKIRNKLSDACVFIFPTKQNSKHFSYVKTNEEGYVLESAEKEKISNIAACGIHYYKKGSDFVKYASNMIQKNIRFNNEFYVTPVYNEFISAGKKITTFEIIKKWALGDPDEIKEFLKNHSKNSE